MTEPWKYQLRIDLADEMAAVARRDPTDPALEPLPGILARHHTTLKSQYDAFAGYVAEAEREGVDKYPLYQWTKDTIEQPAKYALKTIGPEYEVPWFWKAYSPSFTYTTESVMFGP